MATLAIGDVHGNRAALDDLLARLGDELSAADTLVFLGDYIDRGPDSKGCVDSILRLRESCRASVVTLMGNHEDWLLRTVANPCRHAWLTVMQGYVTVASYAPEVAAELERLVYEMGPSLVLDPVPLPYHLFFDAMPPEHLAFFKSLKVYHQTPEAVCTHGGLDPHGGPVERQKRGALIWGAETFPSEYAGPETLVYGHWDDAVLDETGWPRPALGAASIGVDTISHGVLTAIRLPERRVIQSGRHKAR